jgi:hypothetical protein
VYSIEDPNVYAAAVQVHVGTVNNQADGTIYVDGSYDNRIFITDISLGANEAGVNYNFNPPPYGVP